MRPHSKAKTIWLINQFATTPEVGMGGRHYYLAREMAKQGYRVYLIAGGYHHQMRHPPHLKKACNFEESHGFTMVWVRLKKYKKSQSPGRIFNWFFFAWRVSRLARHITGKPDAIVYSSPELPGVLGALSLSRALKVPLAFEVRDIWPLTLQALGGYKDTNPLIRLLQWIEDTAYQKSDLVISNLKRSADHMTTRGMDPGKFLWLPNGISLDEVSSPEPLSPELEAAIPEEPFVIGYTGAMGLANAMDTFLEAALQLKAEADIAFVMVGRGTEVEHYRQFVHEHGLSNVRILDAVAKTQVQSVLARFDATYIGWHDTPLYRFGIGANKLPEYLYAGKPVIHSYSGTSDPVAKHQAGISVPARDSLALSQAVIQLKNMSKKQRLEMGGNARKAAIEYYDYAKLADKLAGKLMG
ncbi:glycosyl transferase, group 1 [gamma proteobacterium HTCC5015]|nr:glycosyl transferase, group 1 [gamma proteobacterium HTCC5015]